jgi:catechol 2,3-dioxygenase-like lactoylglutathione lyase family enzyme
MVQRAYINMLIQRSNTILYCQKWTDTVAFYRDIFEFKITHQTDWFVEFQITSDSYLSIANEQRASISSVNGQGITLSWQVTDIEKAHQHWSAQDVSITSIKKKWGASVFYVHDPEGHRIELWQATSPD